VFLGNSFHDEPIGCIAIQISTSSPSSILYDWKPARLRASPVFGSDHLKAKRNQARSAEGMV
jgi:hypothetical protein